MLNQQVWTRLATASNRPLIGHGKREATDRPPHRHPPVAQLDSARGFYPWGCRFESCLAGHTKKSPGYGWRPPGLAAMKLEVIMPESTTITRIGAPSLNMEMPTWANNKDKRSIRMANAKILGRHTAAEWGALKSYCSSKCVRCGSGDLRVEKDHIIPVYAGGCDCIHNIQPLCARCNASKGPDSSDLRPDGWQEYVTEGASA